MYVCAPGKLGAGGHQKKLSDSLEQELRMVANQFLSAGKETRFSTRIKNARNH